jgi:hypothetical protein
MNFQWWKSPRADLHGGFRHHRIIWQAMPLPWRNAHHAHLDFTKFIPTSWFANKLIG